MTEQPPGWDRVEIMAQAKGIISVQASRTLDEALTLISEQAAVARLGAYDIAIAVVHRSIRLDQ